MDREAPIDHDASLVAWFLQLTPAQRLVESDAHIATLAARGFGLDAGLAVDTRDLLIPRR